MKRIFLLAAALCCMLLYSCDNEQDLGNLSPIELEILELDNLIASQSSLDEDALLADLCRGTMKMTSHYIKENGTFDELLLDGGRCPCIQTIFFEDGTCRDCYSYNPIGEGGYPLGREDSYTKYDWKYDSDTRSIITKVLYYMISPEGEPIYFNDSSMKILYYNTENHSLILEGQIFEYDSEVIRMSGYIDVDPAERERIIEKYCGE